MQSTIKIEFPYKQEVKEIEFKQSMLIVGANGSGKTKLGAWLDSQSSKKDSIYRISAQKLLNFTNSISPVNSEEALCDLLYGGKAYSASNYNPVYRWKNPEVSPLNDFQKLLTYLFSEHSDVTNKYYQDSQESADKIKITKSKILLLKKIWEDVFPERELVVNGNSLQTQLKSNKNNYDATDMSDGERVALYLIGQCLAAPQNSIILVDEPELHLHQSIQTELWKAIEKERNDCNYIYITHDLDFASSLNISKKIWLKSYNGKEWDWEAIESDETIPEELLLKVLGTKGDVLLVEGENSSLDVDLYRQLFENYSIQPVGSCSKVIQLVKSFRDNPLVNHLEVCGLIDRDKRSDEEIDKLKLQRIYTLNVAEVENLFITKEVVELVATQLKKIPKEEYKKVEDFVFKQFSNELEIQICLYLNSEISQTLSNFNQSGKNKKDVIDTYNKLIESIAVEKIYSDVEADLSSIIANKDYLELIKKYNRKSMPRQVGQKCFSLKDREYEELVLRIAKDKRTDQEMFELLRPYLGNIVE